MVRVIEVEHALTAPDAAAIGPVGIAIDGDRIARVAPHPGSAPSLLAMPVMCNAHDHARAARSSSIGAGGKPLEIWLHYLAMLPAVDPYLAAAVSLSRSALGGQGVVMVHYNRVQGLTDYVTEVKAVAKAARDVGVRVGFAVGLRDRNPLVYGPSEPIVDALPPEAAAEIRARFLRPMLPVTEQLALVDDAIAAADHPDFNVQYGPTGVQWCSDALAARDCRSVGAHRPPHSHALPRNALSARLGGSRNPGRHHPLSGFDRISVAAADAGALHLGAAGRTGIAGRARGDDFGQHLVQSRHPFRYRAACRDEAARLPRRLRHRRAGAGRRRRFAARDAADASSAWRLGFRGGRQPRRHPDLGLAQWPFLGAEPRRWRAACRGRTRGPHSAGLGTDRRRPAETRSRSARSAVRARRPRGISPR